MDGCYKYEQCRHQHTQLLIDEVQRYTDYLTDHGSDSYLEYDHQRIKELESNRPDKQFNERMQKIKYKETQ